MSESQMSDGSFAKSFFTMIALMTSLTIFLVVLAHIYSGEVMAKLRSEKQLDVDMIVAERVKPVGEIQVGEPAVTEDEPIVVAAVSGEQTFQQACFACHGTGIAGAPKVGDSAAWTTRIAAGTDALYDHAINGFQGSTGMMPAKGGQAALSDDAVKAAVDYMVEKSK
ncbi:MAG: cytochrome c5 [Parasphingorhabdus sp.]|jgi:cytochrome c5